MPTRRGWWPSSSCWPRAAAEPSRGSSRRRCTYDPARDTVGCNPDCDWRAVEIGCDIHLRAEARDPATGNWRLLGEVFDSERDRHYTVAKRELLDRLTDGQLADGLAYHVERPTEFGSLLSDGLTAALRDYRRRSERDRLVWEEHRSAVFARLDPDADSLSNEAWERLRERERVLTRVRQDSFQLAPELREELIVLADSFRYDYEGYDEDDNELRLSLTLQRADGDPPFKTDEPWDGRNYDLFAMLANVRNGYGFAGVPTGEGFVPIALPRGIPEDASPEAAAFLESYGLDGHSQTFLTLAELDDYDWSGQSTTLYGVVAADTYERLKAQGEVPRSYSGSISGHGIVTFSEEAYAAWVKAGRPPLKEPSRQWTKGDEGFDLATLSKAMRAVPESVPSGSVMAADDALQPQAKTEPVVEVKPYVRMRWRESYREAAGESWFQTLEQLRQQIPDGGTSADVRLVLFFDN